MTVYQTISVEPATTRRLFLPAGATLGVRDPEGCQPFLLTPDEGGSLKVVASDTAAAPVGTTLRRRLQVVSERRGASVTLRAAHSQWVEVSTVGSPHPASFLGDPLPSLGEGGEPQANRVRANSGLLTPQTALRVRMPLASPENQYGDLPEPLAPVLVEHRIDGATAIAYSVKAGQYIQLLNVEGSQCADFLAFAGTNLREELDGVTTRTLNGAAMARAGLHGKYFSQDMTPLVEVIQDTCGRHDSFLLACTDTYYEDAGYPGHASCTTNFNWNLVSYGIAARKGWPAVNFFYNTILGEDGSIVGGESWARPGDFVLLRACRDLLCATSSCADDIDTANGWNPTPIHIRVYDADCVFPRASGHRASRDCPVRMTRDTATPQLRALTDDVVDSGGYWLPNSYAGRGEHEEYWALRERAAIMDLSPLRKFEVSGPDAGALLQWAFSRDISKLTAGQSAYGCLLTAHGGIYDDGLVFRLGENAFRYVGNGEKDGDWLRRQAAERGLDVLIKSSSDCWHNLAVQGPFALDILRPLVSCDLDALSYFRFMSATLNEIPCVISRTGYTGERGYELFVTPDDGPALWGALWDAGKPLGMLPLGLKALDRARIEAGLLSPGREFDASVSPFQAGIGWAVAMKKGNFLGRAALERLREHPPLLAVGLTLEGNEVAPIGKHVYVPGEDFPAGMITSATFSPTLNRSIALAQVFPEYAAHGTVLEVGFVDGMARRVSAAVGPLAAYDPQKTRVKS